MTTDLLKLKVEFENKIFALDTDLPCHHVYSQNAFQYGTVIKLPLQILPSMHNQPYGITSIPFPLSLLIFVFVIHNVE